MFTIVTIGNPARGDDGAGPAVAGLLRARGIAVVEVEEPTRLVDLMPQAGTLVVVDAVVSGAPPGSVVVVDVTSDPLPTSVSASSHTLSLAQGLELARTVGRWPGRVLVVGVEVEAIHAEPGLHDSTRRAVAVAGEMISALVGAGEGAGHGVGSTP